MGRRHYVPMGRRHDIPIRRREDVPLRRLGDVPLRRLGDVPLRSRWVFHLRRNSDVAGKQRDVVTMSPRCFEQFVCKICPVQISF